MYLTDLNAVTYGIPKNIFLTAREASFSTSRRLPTSTTRLPSRAACSLTLDRRGLMTPGLIWPCCVLLSFCVHFQIIAVIGPLECRYLGLNVLRVISSILNSGSILSATTLTAKPTRPRSAVILLRGYAQKICGCLSPSGPPRRGMDWNTVSKLLHVDRSHLQVHHGKPASCRLEL